MKFFNPRDIALIVIVAIAVHIVAKPLYRAIDAETSPGASPDDNA